MKTQTTFSGFAPTMEQIRFLAQSVMEWRSKQKTVSTVVFNTLIPIQHYDYNK